MISIDYCLEMSCCYRSFLHILQYVIHLHISILFVCALLMFFSFKSTLGVIWVHYNKSVSWAYKLKLTLLILRDQDFLHK